MVVDEIDAALDSAATTRVAELLRAQPGRKIVISHRPEVMPINTERQHAGLDILIVTDVRSR